VGRRKGVFRQREQLMKKENRTIQGPWPQWRDQEQRTFQARTTLRMQR
jgi:hypothetical protein